LSWQTPGSRASFAITNDPDLSGLGFKTIPEATGRSAYHAIIKLKLSQTDPDQ
jgi:hypothetical protein